MMHTLVRRFELYVWSQKPKVIDSTVLITNSCSTGRPGGYATQDHCNTSVMA